MEKLPSFATPRLTDVFVERPVLAVVLALVIILLGVRAALELPVLEYPELESSSLQISTRFVGASAETVEGFITDPIERAAVTVPGVDYVDSTTTAGSSLVTVWLELNENSTDALAEMTARLDQIRFELPRDAEDPTIRVVRADRPYAAFYLNVTVGGAYGLAEVTDYLQRNVSPLISAIPGVQRVGLEGGRKPAMRIWLDHDRMSMLDISAGDVQRALQRNNVTSTLGRSKNSKQRMDLLGDTNMKSTEDFSRLVVRDMGGTQVVLSDIARVELGQEEGSRNVRRDHDDAVFISVWPLPGANEIEIGDRLYEVIDEINQKIPPELEIEVGYDATVYMRAALRGIFITLGETVLLVGFVVVMMMGSIRAALVPLIAIPISILGALAAMSAVGFSLNLLTILAIVLSVGLVVDDAIVVVENVARFMREGKSRHEAALLSSRQLLNPIIGMTITLAAVYAPIGFLTGLTGALFKEFAFALSFAVIVSGVVAVTLSPGMSARLAPDGGRQEGFVAWVNRRFDRLRLSYAKALDKSLHLTPQILFFGVFFSLLSIPCFLFSKSELAPVEDQGMIRVIIESAPDATVEFTTTGMAEAVDFMNDLPGTFTMWQILNAEGGFGGQLFRPFDERPRSVHDLLPESYVGLASVPMLKILPNLPAPLPTSGNFAVEFVVVSSEEPADMLPYAQGLVATAMKSGKFLYADTDLRIDFPQARFKLKRDRIADLGMTLEDVSAELSTFLAGDYLNRFDYDGKAYQVIPMIETGGRNDPAAILDYLLKTPDGDFIPVSAVADIRNRIRTPRITPVSTKNRVPRLRWLDTRGLPKSKVFGFWKTRRRRNCRRITPLITPVNHDRSARAATR